MAAYKFKKETVGATYKIDSGLKQPLGNVQASPTSAGVVLIQGFNPYVHFVINLATDTIHKWGPDDSDYVNITSAGEESICDTLRNEILGVNVTSAG